MKRIKGREQDYTRRCFLCGRNGAIEPLDEHHIFGGRTGTRELFGRNYLDTDELDEIRALQEAGVTEIEEGYGSRFAVSACGLRGASLDGDGLKRRPKPYGDCSGYSVRTAGDGIGEDERTDDGICPNAAAPIRTPADASRRVAGEGGGSQWIEDDGSFYVDAPVELDWVC